MKAPDAATVTRAPGHAARDPGHDMKASAAANVRRAPGHALRDPGHAARDQGHAMKAPAVATAARSSEAGVPMTVLVARIVRQHMKEEEEKKASDKLEEGEKVLENRRARLCNIRGEDWKLFKKNIFEICIFNLGLVWFDLVVSSFNLLLCLNWSKSLVWW